MVDKMINLHPMRELGVTGVWSMQPSLVEYHGLNKYLFLTVLVARSPRSGRQAPDEDTPLSDFYMGFSCTFTLVQSRKRTSFHVSLITDTNSIYKVQLSRTEDFPHVPTLLMLSFSIQHVHFSRRCKYSACNRRQSKKLNSNKG